MARKRTTPAPATQTPAAPPATVAPAAATPAPAKTTKPRAPRKSTKTTAAPMPAADMAPPRSLVAPETAGGGLRTDVRSKFTLYNLLGKERAYYEAVRFNLERPSEPVSEKSVAHSVIVIDRSGSMYGYLEDTKETLIKLLTLDEYRNFDLIVSLISYSSRGDVKVHFERAPIGEIMATNSPHLKEIRSIRVTGLTCISQGLEAAMKLIRDNEMTAITLHSDGYANDPSANFESQNIDKIMGEWGERPILVNTIAYSDYSDFRFLSKIANGASGTCVKAGNIRQVYDTLDSTARLLAGAITPPIEEPLSPEYDYQVFVSHSAGKLNGAAGPLHIRGLKPDDDGAIYKFKKLTPEQFHKLEDVPTAQTSEAVLAFARAQLAEGNINTAKYALTSFFDRTLFDKHSRALTNLEVAALAQDIDLLMFQPGILGEHDLTTSPPVNERIPMLTLMGVLAENRDAFLLSFDDLRQQYVRRGLRRVQGTRDESGKLVEPWLKTEFAEKADWVRVSSFDINRNTANLNILISRKVKLIEQATGRVIDSVAGVSLDTLSTFNNYTLVGDGELNVRSLVVKITSPELFETLKPYNVLEVNGIPAQKYDADAAYTIRLDSLPLVPAFEGAVNLDHVFDHLAAYKILSSICTASLKEESDTFTAEQLEELKRHYLSKSLFLSFPTTTEYTDLQQALAEGTVDTRTSYKIDVGSREILNLSKLHSANKALERLYEVTDAAGNKLDKPKFEDCLEGVTFSIKTLSARTKITKVDELMRTYFDDFLGIKANGSATAVLKAVGADLLADIVVARNNGRKPEKAAYVKALTQAGKALDNAADALFNERVSPLVFFIGSTGALPDEIEAKAQTAAQIEAKYPDLALSKDEKEGMFFEVGKAIITVFAKTEYFSRDKTVSGGANVAPAQTV